MRRWLAALVLLPALAWGQSTTFTLVPIHGMLQSTGNQTWGTANALRCIDFIAADGITNATQFGFRLGSTSVSSSTTFGVAVYNADGSTKLGGGTQTGTTADTTLTITGISAFSLTQGTQYRLCWCPSQSTGSYRGTNVTSTVLNPIQNALAAHMGTGTSCTSGATPSTTGTLTAASFIPLVVMVGTNTP